MYRIALLISPVPCLASHLSALSANGCDFTPRWSNYSFTKLCWSTTVFVGSLLAVLFNLFSRNYIVSQVMFCAILFRIVCKERHSFYQHTFTVDYIFSHFAYSGVNLLLTWLSVFSFTTWTLKCSCIFYDNCPLLKFLIMGTVARAPWHFRFLAETL